MTTNHFIPGRAEIEFGAEHGDNRWGNTPPTTHHQFADSGLAARYVGLTSLPGVRGQWRERVLADRKCSVRN